MIADKELAKELSSILNDVMQSLDRSAALVRERSAESEANDYATAVGSIFMCIYGQILDPLYCRHPDLAPAQWSMEP
jgi:hypothetical protein